MSPTYADVPEDRIRMYEAAIAAHPTIERKGGKKLPYTSANGHMFSMLNKAGELGLRLGKDDRESFMSEYDVDLFETYGTIMKEYVTVPDHVINDTDRFVSWLDKSHDYILTLKPKPGKKG